METPFLHQTGAGGGLAIFSQQVWHRSPPLRAIRAHAPNARATYDPGFDAGAAAQSAKGAEVAIVFVHQHTHEGGDVASLALPDAQDALIEAIAAANRRTVVVLETGGPVTMPWIDRVGAVLESWYPGIRGGEAIANILFGDVNPSGKLAVTFPRAESDLPHPNLPAPPGPIPSPMEGLREPRPPFEVRYTEGLKVGYKWFDAEDKQPLFAFGHGLSYTYSELQAKGGKSLSVSFNVRNTGARGGPEIAQIYIAFPPARPSRRSAWPGGNGSLLRQAK